MSNFIQNPISHPEWNPQMGDFYSQHVFEEDRNYEKKQLRKKIIVNSLLTIHLAMLAVIFFYFA
jgi:hypothetical protein